MRIKTEDAKSGTKYRHRVSPGRRVLRGLLHVPVGAFGAWLFERDAPAAKTFAAAFTFYEYIEDKAISDHAYVDYIGWLVGFAGYKLARSVLRKRKGSDT